MIFCFSESRMAQQTSRWRFWQGRPVHMTWGKRWGCWSHWNSSTHHSTVVSEWRSPVRKGQSPRTHQTRGMQHNWSTTNACRRELVRSAVTVLWKIPHNFNSINIIVLIIDFIFIYFVSDHDITGTMPFEVSIIRNNRTSRRQPWRLPRRPIISDNGHLVGHYPLHNLYLITNNLHKKNNNYVLDPNHFLCIQRQPECLAL